LVPLRAASGEASLLEDIFFIIVNIFRLDESGGNHLLTTPLGLLVLLLLLFCHVPALVLEFLNLVLFGLLLEFFLSLDSIFFFLAFPFFLLFLQADSLFFGLYAILFDLL
jgi:hypothetical protein